MVPNIPGSFHDATSYRLSMMRAWLESWYPRVQVLGDSAFSLTDSMIRPYPRAESELHLTKAIFNIRHSAARVEMTENTFGILKRRFLVIKDMRYELQRAFRVIEACGVLHNLSIHWGDVMPRYLYEDEEPGLDPLVRAQPNQRVPNIAQEDRYLQGCSERQDEDRVHCCAIECKGEIKAWYMSSSSLIFFFSRVYLNQSSISFPHSFF